MSQQTLAHYFDYTYYNTINFDYLCTVERLVDSYSTSFLAGDINHLLKNFIPFLASK